jgi:hypothetical protein
VSSLVADSWDAEYRAGRYLHTRQDGFVDDILAAVARPSVPRGRGLYIGCGNGRNYIPLVNGGLDLVGLDVSAAAIQQLAAKLPERAHDLVIGSVSDLPIDAAYSVVIGIQVFQHGDEAQTHEHVLSALGRLVPGGIFCLRVNAVGTDILHRYRLLETNTYGGLTVEYETGPKTGLAIHFFAELELSHLLRGLEPVMPMRLDSTLRTPPESGRWLQWEGIWRHAGSAGDLGPIPPRYR